MLGLGVKINVDSFQLDAATNKLVRFGQQFEHHFWRHMNRLVGAAGLATAVFKLVERIFGKPQEIDETAKKWGMTTDEVQYFTIAAKEAGTTFEDFISRAKKGTVDLQKTLKELHERGVKIVDHEDVATLAKDLDFLKKKWETVENASIHGTATAIRKTEGFFGDTIDQWHRERAKARIKAGVDLGVDAPWAPNGPKGETFGKDDPFDLGNLPPLPISPFGLRLNDLNAQLAQLRSQRAAMKGQAANELITPQLSGWQQIGGYSSQQGAVVAKLDDVKNAVNEVDDAIKRVEQAINNLGN